MNTLLSRKKLIKDNILTKQKLKNDRQKPFAGTLNFLQELGKALQFPIAVLPFAAILNRFGALGVSFSTELIEVDGVDKIIIINQIGYWVSFIIQQPGAIVFANLPLLFAIGVAFALADDHRGEVALVGAIFYLIIAGMTSLAHTLPEMLYKNVLTFQSDNGVFSRLIYVPVIGKDGTTIVNGDYVLSIGVLGGIVAGVLSARIYNKYKTIKLPQALAFFGGRRFVPMIALVATIPVALLFAIIWPWIQYGLMQFGQLVANPDNPAIAIPGTAIYGTLNRLLLPFGLHQIMNTFFWFQLPINGPQIAPITGEIIGAAKWVNGDITAFAKGIAGSGLFQSGFFPIMMGGIPAIALAMIYSAPQANRRKVAGFLGGVALVSLLSGITEPIEFSFVFISPLLLGIHALLTGIIVAATTAMHIQVGFGFSAGLIDYCVSFTQSWGFANANTGVARILANPLWILVLTAGSGLLYFSIFTTVIKKFNIQTPGREVIIAKEESQVVVFHNKIDNKIAKVDKYHNLATAIISAIGQENFVSVDNCATRLRLIVRDTKVIDQAKIKAAGAFGVVVLTKESLQIVIGVDVEHVANSLKATLNL